MDYRDNIKNMQKLNDTYNTVRSATAGFETVTRLSRSFEQMSKSGLTSGVISAIDAMSQTFNHVTALESSMEQASNLVEMARPLAEMNAFQDNNTTNLISEISPILVDVQPASSIVQSLVDGLTDTRLHETITGIESIVSAINNINYSKVLDNISFLNDTLETAAQNMVSCVKWVNQINFDSIVNSLVQTDTLEKTIWEYEQTAGVESATSSEEIKELHNDLQDIAIGNKNWQLRLEEKAKKWKEKNPVIYFVIVQILLPVLLSIFASFIFAKVTAQTAAIKDEPNATGTVIYNITINQEVTIIDNTRYYYKVKYYNKETDKTITGWISKRSIEINNNNPSDEQYTIPVVLDREPTKPVDTYIKPQS